MLKSLSIENFRCFKTFDLNPLGRINLLVGANNSGKTSILEAIQILCAGQDFTPLKDTILRRNEYVDIDDTFSGPEVNINNFFHGYQINDGVQICLQGESENSQPIELIFTFVKNPSTQLISDSLKQKIEKLVEVEIEEKNRNEGIKNPKEIVSTLTEQLNRLSSFNLRIAGLYKSELGSTNFPMPSFIFNIPSSSSGKLKWDYLPYSDNIQESFLSTNFISMSALNRKDLVERFSAIVLNPEEDIVQQSLKLIEPNLDKIAVVNYGKKQVFQVKLRGVSQRVPLENLGEGVRYLLGLTLALVQVPNGILLVDDIDTGLHYSALTEMWKLVWETAKKLNVQVFATTHNSDCWQSLADIAEQDDVSETDITIHRIEKGLERSVFYTAPRIVIAAEHELEVR